MDIIIIIMFFKNKIQQPTMLLQFRICFICMVDPTRIYNKSWLQKKAYQHICVVVLFVHTFFFVIFLLLFFSYLVCVCV